MFNKTTLVEHYCWVLNSILIGCHTKNSTLNNPIMFSISNTKLRKTFLKVAEQSLTFTHGHYIRARITPILHCFCYLIVFMESIQHAMANMTFNKAFVFHWVKYVLDSASFPVNKTAVSQNLLNEIKYNLIFWSSPFINVKSKCTDYGLPQQATMWFCDTLI